jgi:hypothetical protein
MDEALVRRLWLAGGWPAGSLRAVDGTMLQVVYPGRSGRGAGPDLRDAILARADGTLFRGDVELHVRASDWRAHGHTGDARYRDVVLHVVWRDDLGTPIDLPAGAAGPPLTVALAGLPEPILFERLRCPAVADEPYHEWLRGMADDERVAFLERLGDERLAAKAARLGADLHALGPAEALHRGLLDALGYSQNRDAFAQLAEVVSAAELWNVAAAAPDAASAERDCLALLFGAAGLLDEARLARVRDDDGRAIAEDYRRRAEAIGPTMALKPGTWELIGVRPANRPARRLAGLSRLAAETRRERLYEAVLACFRLDEPRAAVRALLDLVRVPGVRGRVDAPRAADFWARHHDFGRRLPGAPQALVGEDRARAVLANVLLPFGLALADAAADRRLEERVRAAWALAPAGAANWVLAEVRPLLGRTPIARARREQGAIELYRRCCEERRCATCPAGSLSQVVGAGRP